VTSTAPIKSAESGVARNRQIVATSSVNSWMGTANPASPNNAEQGNNVFFGVAIHSNFNMMTVVKHF
jgi:hypothetical protein